MRLALLGPAENHADALEAAVRFLVSGDAVDRVVYLGVDGALDSVVRRIATGLVGENPSEEGIWSRSVRSCLRADPAAIDAYVRGERARAHLRMFESLLDAETRAVEMLSGALVVMIYDKAALNEEDMLPARLLLFGKSRVPVVKQVGQRWFLSPGSFEAGGLLTLEDGDDGILLTLYDRQLGKTREERLSAARGTKLTIGPRAGAG